MRFALIGVHPDGVAFARALADGGRHEIAAFCGVGAAPVPCGRTTADLEDILADPRIEACIVAVVAEKRLDVTRRVLQSERHAAVVHPVDCKPDGAYELNMLQGDVHQVLLPLLPEAFATSEPLPTELIDIEFSGPDDQRLAVDATGRHPAFPGWTLLRRLGGEIVEVSTFARGEQVSEHTPMMTSGLFVSGTAFRCLYRRRPVGEPRVTVQLVDPEATEPFPLRTNAAWPLVVAEFEAAVAALKTTTKADPAAGGTARANAQLSWHDAIRAHELDDASARSLAKRRTSLLEYQEANEEVGFKGTMTLVGCGMLWMLVVVLIISAFMPKLFWVTLPILLVFLALQLLRWAVPPSKQG